MIILILKLFYGFVFAPYLTWHTKFLCLSAPGELHIVCVTHVYFSWDAKANNGGVAAQRPPHHNNHLFATLRHLSLSCTSLCAIVGYAAFDVVSEHTQHMDIIVCATYNQRTYFVSPICIPTAPVSQVATHLVLGWLVRHIYKFPCIVNASRELNTKSDVDACGDHWHQPWHLYPWLWHSLTIIPGKEKLAWEALPSRANTQEKSNKLTTYRSSTCPLLAQSPLSRLYKEQKKKIGRKRDEPISVVVLLVVFIVPSCVLLLHRQHLHPPVVEGLVLLRLGWMTW
jgi:hypothetical protein